MTAAPVCAVKLATFFDVVVASKPLPAIVSVAASDDNVASETSRLGLSMWGTHNKSSMWVCGLGGGGEVVRH